MGDGTHIEWSEATWNPVRGCSRISPGCVNCYAESTAKRFAGPGQPYEGLVRLDALGKPKAQWNGVVRLVPEHLHDPLRWQRPRRIFVNSMSDLFHESLSFDEIDMIFDVMRRAERHTFQVLTKRATRLLEYTTTRCWEPLRNVLLGVSVEDEVHARLRIPQLVEAPAAMRFISYEPALGPLAHDVEELAWMIRALDWAIVGGESTQPGRPARAFDPQWARDLITAAKGTRCRVFVKQLGSEVVPSQTRDLGTMKARHPKRGDPDEWTPDLRVREYPD